MSDPKIGRRGILTDSPDGDTWAVFPDDPQLPGTTVPCIVLTDEDIERQVEAVALRCCLFAPAEDACENCYETARRLLGYPEKETPASGGDAGDSTPEEV